MSFCEVKRAATVSAAMASLMGLALFGCGKPGGEASSAPGGMVSHGAPTDSAGFLAEADQALKADKSLTGAQIKASEQGGFISLEGSAVSQDQKDRAEKIVTDLQKARNRPPGVLDNLMLKESGAGQSGGAGSTGSAGK